MRFRFETAAHAVTGARGVARALVVCACLGAPAAARPSSRGGPGPLERVQQVQGAVARLLRVPVPPPGRASRRDSDERIRAAIGGLVDFREISRAALAGRWDGLDEARRAEFVAAHRAVIERKFIRQMRKHARHTVTYGGGSVEGDTATVSTRVRDDGAERAAEATIQYRLRRRGADWMVVDIVTDGTSIADDYRQQFDEILRTGSLDALLARLREIARRP